jgi:hypothetical protein
MCEDMRIPEVFVEASGYEKEVLEALNFHRVDLDFIKKEVSSSKSPKAG